jgi:hypothetical protein
VRRDGGRRGGGRPSCALGRRLHPG